MYKHKIKNLNKTTITEINTPISGISINQEEILSEKSYIIYSHLEKYDIYLLQKSGFNLRIPQSQGKPNNLTDQEIVSIILKKMVRKGTKNHIAEGTRDPFSIPNTPMLRA